VSIHFSHRNLSNISQGLEYVDPFRQWKLGLGTGPFRHHRVRPQLHMERAKRRRLLEKAELAQGETVE
jgi:hypothetical protein